MRRINTTQHYPGRWAFGLLFLLAGCTAGEQETGDRRPLEITAEIAAPLTRAITHENDYDKQSFVDGDNINIYTGGTVSGTATSYQLNGNGTQWLPANGTGITLTADGGTFTASYPTTFSSILQDQTDKDKFWSSNQLISTATAVGNRVAFLFAPAAAKITVNIEYKDESTTGAGVKLTGNGLCTGAASEEAVELLPLTTTGKEHQYIGIVYPGIKTSYKIEVSATTTTATETVTVTKTYNQNSEITLEAAHNYIYNFTSTDNLILNGVQVTSFASDSDAENGGDLSAT